MAETSLPFIPWNIQDTPELFTPDTQQQETHTPHPHPAEEPEYVNSGLNDTTYQSSHPNPRSRSQERRPLGEGMRVGLCDFTGGWVHRTFRWWRLTQLNPGTCALSVAQALGCFKNLKKYKELPIG